MILPLADASFAIGNLIRQVCTIITVLIVIYVLLDLARNFMRAGLPPAVIQFHQALGRIFEPIFKPIRDLLPDLGGLDFSPLIVIVLLEFIGNLVA